VIDVGSFVVSRSAALDLKLDVSFVEMRSFETLLGSYATSSLTTRNGKGYVREKLISIAALALGTTLFPKFVQK
jgi:hypothetical protein